MAPQFSRRRLFSAAASTLVASACAHRFASLQREFAAAIAAIQSRVGGRIGAYMLDTQSQLELAFNERERFAMCSTFKLMLAAAILKRGEAGTLSLDDKVPVRAQDMVPYAPVTSAHVAAGSMSVGDAISARHRRSRHAARSP